MAEALKKSENRELYFKMLGSWKEMLNEGLTTFKEGPEPSRSDCHAWSASPLYHYYSLICGIEPVGAHFTEIKIAPVFGPLKWLRANLTHRLGIVGLDLRKNNKNNISGEIKLPAGLNGTFYWNDKKVSLKSGTNYIDL